MRQAWLVSCRYLKKPVIYKSMFVSVISIWINSYQVVNTVRKNDRMVVRARIFSINYQIWPKLKQKMNRLQKIIYESKYDIRVIPIWFISHEDVCKIFKNFVLVATSIIQFLTDYQL